AAVQPRRGDSTPAIQGLSPLRGWVVGAADVRPRGSRPWLFTTAPSGLSFQRTIPRRPAPCKAVACTFIQDTAPSRGAKRTSRGDRPGIGSSRDVWREDLSLFVGGFGLGDRADVPGQHHL